MNVSNQKFRRFRYCATVTVLLMLMGLSSVSAQEGNYRFGHLSIDDGLSQNLVFSIAQDCEGFIWVGTYDGLNRYDGYDFKKYSHRPADSLSLSANQILAILEDSKQNLWVGAGGLNLYDRRHDRFVRMVTSEQIGLGSEDIEIEEITEDHNGDLWFYVRDAGLFRLEYSESKADMERAGIKIIVDTLIGPYEIPDELIANTYRPEGAHLAVAGNSLWISIEKGVILLKASENGSFPDPDRSEFKVIISSKEFDGTTTHAMQLDNKGNLWVGIRSGLIRIPDPHYPNNYQYYPFPAEDFSNPRLAIPKSLAVDQEGNIWIATYEGVLLFESGTKEFQHIRYQASDPEGLSYPSITEVFVDRGNIIWLGTAGLGLNTYADHRKQFEHFLGKEQTITIYSVYSLLDDQHGDIWFSALSGLLFYFDKQTGIVQEMPMPDPKATWAINSMVKDTGGTFWFSNDHLLVRYDPENKTGSTTRISKLVNGFYFPVDSSYTLLADPSGDIWLCNTRFLKRYDPENGILSQYPLPELPLKRVNAFYQDGWGIFWIACLNGLLRFNLSTQQWHWFHPDPKLTGSLPYDHLTSLLPDPKEPEHYLWVGTGGGGLVRLNMLDETFTAYSTENGLPNNFIYGILGDDSGQLWMSTNHGLSCYDPATKQFRNYDLSHGLQSNEFNTRSYYRNSDGKMLFGGINGITSFYPDRIITNPHLPQIVLTGLQLSYEPVTLAAKDSPLEYSITETKQIRLKHDQRTLAFEFAALEYTNPEKNLFRYVLEGFDNQWINAGTNRNAYYTNLPAGRFTFRVQGSNNDGLFNPEDASIEVIIARHPWVKWYAILLYTLLCATIVFFIHRYLQDKSRAQLEISRREEETRRLTELDQFKSQFFANVSHEFRTPISLIQGHLDDLLNELKREDLRMKVQSALRNSTELLRLIDQLLDLARLESNKMKLHPEIRDLVKFTAGVVNEFQSSARQRKLSLEFQAVQGMVLAGFDPGAMNKIIRNLIANALKFTPSGGVVRVKVGRSEGPDQSPADRDNGTAFIEISDTGIGIPGEHLEHIFDRFYQVSEDPQKAIEGFGLGLGMVRELTELHDGRVRVKSEPGKGSAFTVTLPSLGPGETETDPALVRFSERSGADLESPVFGAQNEGRTFAKQPWSSMTSKVILVVEDHSELREYIQVILQQEYHVIEAPDGRVGLEMAREKMPDLIISDIMMPGLDGYELIRQLMGDQLTSHIPVIILTARAETNDRLKGLDLGADDYLVKPFNQEELVSRVRNILRKREELQKKYASLVLGDPSLETESSTEQAFLKRVRKLIDENLDSEGFGVEQLSESLHMSPSSLYRKLQALTNFSTIQLIHHARLEKAVMLLKKGLGVGEVAYRVGFHNPSSFTNFFKKYYGVSPREYLNK